MKNLPPLPKTSDRDNEILLQIRIDKEFWSAIAKEMKSRKYTRRQVMEYGLRAFLLKANPKEATRLGIHPQED